MPTIKNPPPLLFLKDEKEYLDYYELEYNNKVIVIPEGKSVYFFPFNKKDDKHPFCGKNNKGFNFARAQRLPYIKFLLETQEVRVIKKSVKNENIIFICSLLNYVVICYLLKNGNLKFITQYVLSKDDIKKFEDVTKYIDCTFV